MSLLLSAGSSPPPTYVDDGGGEFIPRSWVAKTAIAAALSVIAISGVSAEDLPAHSVAQDTWKAPIVWTQAKVPQVFNDDSDFVAPAATQPFGNSQPWLVSPISFDQTVLSLFWHNDDIVPQIITFVVLEDDNWSPPVIWNSVKPVVFTDDDVIVPQAVSLVFEEDSWVVSAKWPQAIVQQFPPDDSDFVYPATTPAILTEEGWLAPTLWFVPAQVPQFSFNDEIVPQAATLVFEDDNWSAPALWQNLTAVSQFSYNDDIVPVVTDDLWIPVIPWTQVTLTQIFSFNDEIVAQPVIPAFEDDSWTKPVLWLQVVAQRPQIDDSDYVYPATTGAIVDDAEWPLNKFRQVWQSSLFSDNNDVPTLYGVPSDELGWTAPVIWPTGLWSKALQFADDDFAVIVIPPPILPYGNSQPWLAVTTNVPSVAVTVWWYNDELVTPGVTPALPYGNSRPWIPVTTNVPDSIVTVWWQNDEITTAVIPPPPYPTLVGCAQLFNTYYILVDKFCVYNIADVPVSFAFQRPTGCALPLVRFTDDNPFDSIPRIAQGDWLDIYIDTVNGPSLYKSVQYLGHNDPQTYLLSVPCGAFITISRNNRYHHIHTTPNTFSAKEASKWGVNVFNGRGYKKGP